MHRNKLVSGLALAAALVACSSAGKHNGTSSSSGGGTTGPTGTSGGSGFPHCSGVASTCGAAGDENCCTSNLVPGGTFHRSYDGVSWKDAAFPATVSDFKLDRFLVTVGRMRSFVTAVENGWQPAAGSGKHEHLNGGGGVNGGTEGGWDPSWNAGLATDRAGWDQNLLCDSKYQTWTSDAGGNEQRPINCVEWQEAYAFCIWDGGFLPTEAEINYAAAGGNEQRVYPWSTPPTDETIDCS
ncbi:MAG TPA: SUMF1/EgtB/PvdO family nonheme iron enzyme, partial [Polyangiaceae bacterium]